MINKLINILNHQNLSRLNEVASLIKEFNFDSFNKKATLSTEKNQFYIANINNEKFGLSYNEDLYLFESSKLKRVNGSELNIRSYFLLKSAKEGIQIKNENSLYEKFVITEEFRNNFKNELLDEGYNSDLGIEILHLIDNNLDSFKYEYLGQLKKDIKFRLSSIQIMESQINTIPHFGNYNTKATVYWEITENEGLKLKKDSYGKNLNPALALDALINDANLRLDCSGALVLLENLTLKRELGDDIFAKSVRNRPLYIQPLIVQNRNNTKRYREADFIELTKNLDENQFIEQLIPGDRGYFRNYEMQDDPYIAEFVLYVGKENGEHYFRGHPFKTKLSYEEMKAKLILEYERWLGEKDYRKDEREQNWNFDYETLGKDVPGLYKTIERPDIEKLRDIY